MKREKSIIKEKKSSQVYLEKLERLRNGKFIKVKSFANRYEKEVLAKKMNLLGRIEQSEEQVKARKVTKADASWSDEVIDDLLMH